MRFALWLKESSEGCDYTVGCGNALLPLNAETVEGALDEAKGELLDRTHVRLDAVTDQPNMNSRIFQQALLVSVASDITVIAAAVGEKKRREQVKKREAEKLERHGEAVAKLQAEQEDQLDKTVRELTELLRQKGHQIVDPNDYAMMIAVIRKRLYGTEP